MRTKLWPWILVLAGATTNISNAGVLKYEITGTTSATVGSTFFSNTDFAIEFIIDDTTPDQFPESNRGAFAGGTTVVSIPEAGINSAVSTNIDGLFLQDFGSTILNLVSTNNFFGSVALGLIWNQSGVLGSVDSINPISDSAPDPNAAQGGLTLQFAGGQPNVTLNSVSSARLTTQIAAVPEPGGSMLMMVFAFAMSWQRKRPRKKFVA